MDGLSPIFRRLPHNIDAEMALLGAILASGRTFERVSAFLRAEHFVLAENARVFDACRNLIDRGQTADPVSMKAWADADTTLAGVGGSEYLARLFDCRTTPISAVEYGRLVYDLALRRELIALGESIVSRAYESGIDEPADTQAADAELALTALTAGHTDDNWKTLGDAAREAIAAADKVARGEVPPAIRTGLSDLDRLITGLKPGKLYVIGARPAMGKTALALNIAVAAARAGAPVGFFSMEMPAPELGTRELSRMTGLSARDIDSGAVDTDDMSRLVGLCQDMARLPVLINDQPGLTIAQIRRMARRARVKHRLRVVMVDYLQLCRTEGKRDWMAVGEIATGLKNLAREEGLAVVALCQLNRDVEKRVNKRPTMADLRESGNIEQDSDVIMLLHRQEVYLQREEPDIADPAHAEWSIEMDKIRGQAELIVDKHRGGRTGVARLSFDGATTSFGDRR